LALARRTGWPKAIHQNLLALASALASGNAEQAGELLHEALDVKYDNNTVNACFVAGRLADWPAVLLAAGRSLQWNRGTGMGSRLVMAGIFSFVARALARSQPEAAAILQGAARGLSVALGPAEHVIVKVRDQTTRLLADNLGENRLRELNSQGENMEYGESFTYALDVIKRSEKDSS
jgi:hypothetical protein